MSESGPFHAAFRRWAQRVRSRLALRYVLTGATFGLIAGAAGTAAAWYFRIGPERPLGAAIGVVGAGVGLLVARRKRWRDGDVALYLDARLGSNEAIATALELDKKAAPEFEDARAVVVAEAARTLAAAKPERVRPHVLRASHGALPLAAVAIGYLSLRPLPPAPPAPPAPPGVERVRLADIAGLDKIEKLGDLDGRDEAQRERLKQLSAEAKLLRQKLRDGMEKREALADIAKLKDGITAERMSLGDGEQRQGLESAASKLAENPDLKKASKALGDRDLVSFDQEMERIANQAEQQDRDKAKETLEQAAAAAKKNGAKDVAKELERQKDLLEERGKKADKLRELAKELGDSLGDDGKQSFDDWKGSGSRKDTKELERHLEEALGKLTPEQRKKLAENLKKKMAKGGDAKGPSKERMKELAEQLDTPEGQEQLEEELRKMAEDDESKREEALDDAEGGAGEAEGELGAPIPIPMAGKSAGKGKPGDKDQKGNPSAGHTDDPPGKADHEGLTGVIQGGDLKSRANAKINKGRAMPGVVLGRASGRAGETANVQGEGALGEVGPGEVSGVERSEVPEEYREQVGRYFQPK